MYNVASGVLRFYRFLHDLNIAQRLILSFLAHISTILPDKIENEIGPDFLFTSFYFNLTITILKYVYIVNCGNIFLLIPSIITKNG